MSRLHIFHRRRPLRGDVFSSHSQPDTVKAECPDLDFLARLWKREGLKLRDDKRNNRLSSARRETGLKVQILFAPHFSLQIFGDVRESIEIGACARDLRSSADPESISFWRDSPELANSSLGAICLGPRIIATDSPLGFPPTIWRIVAARNS